jgi:hypothetical protein
MNFKDILNESFDISLPHYFTSNTVTPTYYEVLLEDFLDLKHQYGFSLTASSNSDCYVVKPFRVVGSKKIDWGFLKLSHFRAVISTMVGVIAFLSEVTFASDQKKKAFYLQFDSGVSEREQQKMERIVSRILRLKNLTKYRVLKYSSEKSYGGVFIIKRGMDIRSLKIKANWAQYSPDYEDPDFIPIEASNSRHRRPVSFRPHIKLNNLQLSVSDGVYEIANKIEDNLENNLQQIKDTGSKFVFSDDTDMGLKYDEEAKKYRVAVGEFMRTQLLLRPLNSPEEAAKLAKHAIIFLKGDNTEKKFLRKMVEEFFEQELGITTPLDRISYDEKLGEILLKKYKSYNDRHVWIGSDINSVLNQTGDLMRSVVSSDVEALPIASSLKTESEVFKHDNSLKMVASKDAPMMYYYPDDRKNSWQKEDFVRDLESFKKFKETAYSENYRLYSELRRYTGADAFDINRMLRDAVINGFDDYVDGELIAALQEVDIPILETPIWVYRNAHIPSEKGNKFTPVKPTLDEMPEFALGVDYVDPAFLSTSLSSTMLLGSAGNLRMKIFLPKGTPYLPVLGDLSKNPQEKEIILLPLSAIRIVERCIVQEDNGGGDARYKMNIVGCYVGNAYSAIENAVLNNVSDPLIVESKSEPTESKDDVGKWGTGVKMSVLKKIRDALKKGKIVLDK